LARLPHSVIPHHGSSAQPSTDGADMSTFTTNTYGVFLSHTDHARLTNELEGSPAPLGRVYDRLGKRRSRNRNRNGANGFVV
jgi:hypothetical protein